MAFNDTDYLHVVVAAIVNDAGEVLIARRPEHVHQGGLWEFPGGKIEAGESVPQALRREMMEELGIEPQALAPLIRIPHAYHDRKVLLDVWRVTGWSGEPHGREGQPLRWVPLDQLDMYRFPEANRPILSALSLPPLCLVTPDPGATTQWPAFLARLQQVLAGGVRMVQLRAKTLSEADYLQLAAEVSTLCRRYGAMLMLNAPAEWASRVDVSGVHLSSQRLREMTTRPDVRWLSAACHDLDELRRALTLGVDFVLVSPVQASASHPQTPPLGWERFAALAESSPIPVYALGGVGPEDLPLVRARGGQGIAAISALWALGVGDEEGQSA